MSENFNTGTERKKNGEILRAVEVNNREGQRSLKVLKPRWN